MNIQKFKYTHSGIYPPGFYRTFLPGKNQSQCVVADIFDNHRFLFYSLCTNKKDGILLDLVTIDYHQDLCEPFVEEKRDLKSLDLSDEKEVAYFCWNHLNPSNDGHILATMYVELINDVVVICKEGDEKEFGFKDKNGNEHKIYCYHKKEDFDRQVRALSKPIHFDIDLDYFVRKHCNESNKEVIEVSSNIADFRMLDVDSTTIKNLQGKLKNLTIAREPEHCGGVGNSNKILERVSSKLFYGDVWGGSKEGLRMYST